MNSKVNFILSIILMVLGLLAIASFVILCALGEAITKWIPACILSVIFVINGFVSIVRYKKQKHH